jgi:DNA polymerase III alpha subunit
MKIDERGNVLLSAREIAELWLCHGEDTPAFVENSPEIEKFNAMCREKRRDQMMLSEPGETAKDAGWFMGEELEGVDLREYLDSLCTTDVERARVAEEMDLFERYDLLPVLRAMICLVAHLRDKGVLWGVGRGSSVASFVLFLIGVHRINPLKYDLPITDFLKP